MNRDEVGADSAIPNEMATASLRDQVTAQATLPAPHTCRGIREAARISQATVAREVGVSAQCIGHWEAGRRRPNGTHVVAYVRLLAMLRDVVSFNDDDPVAAGSHVRAVAGGAGHRVES